MKKAICPKCRTLINVDESSSAINCPSCHELIDVNSSIKYYYQSISVYRHKGDVAFEKKGDYLEAYKNYELLHALAPNELGVLIAVVMAKLRISTVSKITIKEATDLLLKWSDEIEINYDNVATLSDFLIKIREDSNLIVKACKEHASKEIYTQALKEYKYYLENYLKIYQSLDKLNQYLKDSKELINDEIKKTDQLLSNPLVDSQKQDAFEIFPNKIKQYRLHITLYVLTAVGAFLSLLGLIFLTTLKNQIVVQALTLSFGLVLFIGGYFLNHYLTYTRPKRKNK